MSKALSVGPQPKSFKYGRDYTTQKVRREAKDDKGRLVTWTEERWVFHPSAKVRGITPTPKVTTERQSKRVLRLKSNGHGTTKPIAVRRKKSQAA